MFKALRVRKQGLGFVRAVRSYAIRRENDSPFDYLPKHRKKPFINWKATAIFVAIGSYLSYNETLLDKYEEFTETQENDDLLPIQLSFKLRQLPVYQSLIYPKNGQVWTKLETWEDLDHNILDKQDFSSKRTKKVKETGERAGFIEEPNGTTKSMISSTLAKPGGFLMKPMIFHNLQTNEGVTIVHAGYKLCGYPFIVHGGILATILNETFKRNAALCNVTTSSYKGDFKVENLSISYKFPSFANQFLIVRTKKVPFADENDRLIRLESTIESENGKMLVKSSAVLHDTGLVSKANSKSLKNYIGLK